MKRRLLLVLSLALGTNVGCSQEVLRYHTLRVDGQNKIIPWFTPTTSAFDNYLDKCWAWAVAAPNDSHGLPISFLYCAWKPGNPPTADQSWENDVGEKIPNWVESARLYYQYCGDRAPLDYVKRLVDYSLEHGQTPANHAWPDFPVGTSNAGDTEFRGFTGVWSLWDCHVDLAADIGFSMYRMYQMYGDAKYRDKAIQVADLLAAKMVPGTATDSPWPYVVNSQTGANKSRYAASWDGALELFDLLIENNHGAVSNYVSARATLKHWLLTYPMQNGNWVDGHSDVKFNGTGNKSTTCASDMCLYLLEHPGWDTNFLTDVPKLLKWAEDNFVNVSTPDGLAGQYHGAYVPGEQTAYMYRMGYQAARLGAQYALWYEVSGNVTYKDRAYRCLSYNTYMMQSNGQSSDGPTATVGYWWSDCYGEATRMYYYGMAAVPEWAPPGENHLLRSSSVVKSITYNNSGVGYTTWDPASTEVFRLSSVPGDVLADGMPLPRRSDLAQPGWTYDVNSGVLRVRHESATQIEVVYAPPFRPPSQPVSRTRVYSGLFYNSTNILQSSGYLTLTANTRGAFSGKISVEGRTYPFHGMFTTAGLATVTVSRAHQSSLTLQLRLDGEDYVVGTVGSGNWLTALHADRAVFGRTNACGYAGVYTFMIPGSTNGSSFPGGDSYWTVTVRSSGSAALVGSLADGTKVSQGTSIAKDGRQPLYVPLYRGGGLIIGWMNYVADSTNSLGGDAVWIKPPLAGKGARYYPSGFSENVVVSGMKYTPPLRQESVFSFTDGIVLMQGGNLGDSVQVPITLTANNKVVGSGDAKLRLALKTARGTFTGSLSLPSSPKVHKLNGVLLRQLDTGYGYFLGTDQSGQVRIGATPQ